MEKALGISGNCFNAFAFLFPRCLPTNSLALGPARSCLLVRSYLCSGRSTGLLKEAVILNGSKWSQLLPIIYLLDLGVTRNYISQDLRLLCSLWPGLSFSEFRWRCFIYCELNFKVLSWRRSVYSGSTWSLFVVQSCFQYSQISVCGTFSILDHSEPLFGISQPLWLVQCICVCSMVFLSHSSGMHIRYCVLDKQVLH